MEHIRKCNVCGKIYCYSTDDLKDNAANAAVGALSAIGAIASVFEGTRWDTYALNNQSDRYTNRVVNYNKCPLCNSTNTVLLSEQECKEIQQKTVAEISTNKFQARKIEINSNATTESLLKRIKMFLEESDWESASAYAEQVLDIDPECAMAYVYKLMINLNVTKQEDLSLCNETFYENKMYQKAIRFADESLLKTLEGYNYTITERNNNDRYTQAINQFNSATTEEECLSLIPLFQNLGKYRYSEEMLSKCKEKANLCKYKKAMNLMSIAKFEEEFLYIKGQFELLGDYEDSKANSLICKEKAEEARKNAIYEEAISCASINSISKLEEAINIFDKIPEWRDSELKKDEAKNKIKQIKIAEKKASKKKKIICISIALAVVAFIVIVNVIKIEKYNSAKNKYLSEDYIGALEIWIELGNYKDSESRTQETAEKIYNNAIKLAEQKEYDEAILLLDSFQPCVANMNDKAYWYCMIAYAYVQNGENIEASNAYSLAYENTDNEEMKSFCAGAKELYSLDDGESHNLKKMYDNIEAYASELNQTSLLEEPCFNYMLALNGKWTDDFGFAYIRITNGHFVEYYYDGDKEEDYIFYEDGGYYIGSELIEDFNGPGDNSFTYFTLTYNRN